MTPIAAMLVASVVRAWTWLYTCGMPLSIAERRRAEIHSDLWEHQHDPEGNRGVSHTLHVFIRLIAGASQDLAWRIEHDFVPGTFRRVMMVGTTSVFLLVGLWVVPLWSGKPHQHCVSQQQAGANALNPSADCECEQRSRPAGAPRTERRSGAYIVRVVCRP